MWAVLLYSACALAGSRGRLIERQVRDMILGRWSEGAMDRSKKKNARLANLNKAKKVQHRHELQDWSVWLSKPDSKGNDVNLVIENIHLEELLAEDNLVYDRLKEKFKNPLVGVERFYLQYKLASEQYPVNLELSQKRHLEAAFTKFARLKPDEYAAFGPTMVLYCRGPAWTLPPTTVGVITTELKGRPALTRYLTNKYTTGKLSLAILDEIMTFPTGPLRRAVHGVMPAAEREHHEYLLQNVRKKEPSPQELYLSGAITLKDFEEIRFPDAKLERERRAAHYPTPEEPQRCIVCREVTATIKCMECFNKVCQACVRRECLERPESFLYFHGRHCLRFGRPFRKPLLEMEDVKRRGRHRGGLGGD